MNDEMDGTVYRSPDRVTCPTCGEAPNRPCQRVNGGGAMRVWHLSRERIPFPSTGVISGCIGGIGGSITGEDD